MKHKRIVGLALAVGMIGTVFASMGNGVTAKADGVDWADQSFIDFVLEDTEYEGELLYTHTPLYDETLEVNGRWYDFSIGEVEGYALLVELQVVNQVFYEVEELFYSSVSPFDGCEGLPVYITHGLYLDYKDGEFYNLATDTVIADETLAECAYKGFGYRGSGTTTEVTQTVTYATKDIEEYHIQYEVPNIFGSVDGITSCANTAGGILICYYDRFCENLIPNFKSYVQIGGGIRYRTSGTEIANVITQLYTLMGTDVNQPGTTYSGFQSGMQQYVTGKGYTYTTTNLFSNGSFNINNYKNAVQNGKPVALFLSAFAMITNIVQGNSTDSIISDDIDSSHATIGYGYRIDTYYNANGQIIDTRYYLKVASGLATYGTGFLNINGLGIMDRAISVQIS